MNFTVAAFRAAFPEFGDDNKYTNAMITFWASVATQMVQQCRWKGMYLQGVYLYVAHEVTLEVAARATAAIGGTPGQNPGIVASKAIGAVNASYDRASTSEKNAWFWNLTNYGQQFIRLARIFGAGAIQL